MKLNCDLGESFGAWKMADDAAIMPHIDMANIACGFHAGDPMVLAATLRLALTHEVTLGAHPGYPDLQGFGRRSMTMKNDEITALLHYQIAAIEGMARCQGGRVRYVKPHGALYNDMMRDTALFTSILDSVASYPLELALVVLAGAQGEIYKRMAHARGVRVWLEGFADRRYLDDGRLMPRNQSGAVLAQDEMLAQVRQLCQHQCVTTASGKALSLSVDTLCIHGDSNDSATAAQMIRQTLDQQG